MPSYQAYDEFRDLWARLDRGERLSPNEQARYEELKAEWNDPLSGAGVELPFQEPGTRPVSSVSSKRPTLEQEYQKLTGNSPKTTAAWTDQQLREELEALRGTAANNPAAAGSIANRPTPQPRPEPVPPPGWMPESQRQAQNPSGPIKPPPPGGNQGPKNPGQPRGKSASVTAEDMKYYKELESYMPGFSVLPSNEINKGIRRVAIQKQNTGETIALDLQVHRNINATGPVFTVGELTGTKSPAVIQPRAIGRFNREEGDVTFQGQTSTQGLAQRVLEGFQAYEQGITETPQKGFSASLAGHTGSEPVPRLPANAPEAVHREMLSRVGFEKKLLGSEESPAPFEAKKIEEAYVQGVLQKTGPIGTDENEEVSWTNLRSRGYFPSKRGGLEPYANIVYSKMAGQPGGQGVMSAEGELLTGLKGMGKRSVTYGGIEVQPYVRQLDVGGAETYVPQRPEPISAEEGQDPTGYRVLTGKFPGEKNVRAAEVRRLRLTPTPFSGAAIVHEDVNPEAEFRGTEGQYREKLPLNLRELLSGETKITAGEIRGQRYGEGSRPFTAGTFTKGGEEFPIEMQKGVAPFVPRRAAVQIPAFWDPQTGKPVASEKFGQSTKSLLPQLQEMHPGVEFERGTAEDINYLVQGAVQRPARIRGFDQKSGIVLSGERSLARYGGTNRVVHETTGEVKGPTMGMAFMMTQNWGQLQGIMRDWEGLQGTKEATKLREYFERTFQPKEGEAPQVDYEKLASRYRKITAGLPYEERFRGGGVGMAKNIFEPVFMQQSEANPLGVNVETPEGALRNVKNWQQYGGAVVGQETISAGPTSPEQYEMLRGFAQRAIRQIPGQEQISDEEANKLFESTFQLGGGGNQGMQSAIANALRSTKEGQGLLQQMTFPSAKSAFVGTFATPMVADDIAEARANIEQQMAISEGYNKFGRALGLNLEQPTSENWGLRQAVGSMASFAGFTKEAITSGKMMTPEGAETLTEDQWLQIKELYSKNDVSNQDFLGSLEKIVKDPNAMLRAGKTGAVLPSIQSMREMSYSKYEEEIGPVLGQFRKSLGNLGKEELSIFQKPGYNPTEAGTRAVQPLYRHAERLLQGEGDIAKHMFSKDVNVGWAGRYQLDLALGSGQVYLPEQMRRMVLGQAGLRGGQIEKNLGLFEQQNLYGLMKRDPLMMTESLVPFKMTGEGEMRQRRGEGNYQRWSNLMQNRGYGYAFTDLALSQVAFGDLDADLINMVIGAKKQGGRVTPLPMSQIQELQEKELTPQRASELEARAIPNQYERDKSNAFVQSMMDVFQGIGPRGEVQQADVLGKGMGKYGFYGLEAMAKRAQTITESSTIGMGTSFNVMRQNLVAAAMGGQGLTGATGGMQAIYQPFLDVWNLGQEAGGMRLPAATSKFYAGMDEKRGNEPFVGYSTNVKNEEGFSETNRLYAKDIGQGGALEYLSKLAIHATAPVQEEGKAPQYLLGPEQLAFQFGKQGDQASLQRQLEGMKPEEYGFGIQKYLRGLQTPEQKGTAAGVMEYEKGLMQLPIMQHMMARATSKAQNLEGEQPKQALQSLEAFKQVLGTEQQQTWETGASMHDLLYRFPRGAIAAGRLTDVSGIKNPILRAFSQRAQQQFRIPVSQVPQAPTPEESAPVQQAISNLENVAQQPMSMEEEIAAAAQQAFAQQPLSEDERSEFFRLNAGNIRTPEDAQRYRELKARLDAGDQQKVEQGLTGTPEINQKYEAVGGGEGTPPPKKPWNADLGDPGPIRGGGGGGGGTGGRPVAPMSPRQANRAVEVGYALTKKYETRVPQVMLEVAEQLGLDQNSAIPLFMQLGQRMQVDPEGTLARLSPRTTQKLKRLTQVSDARAKGLGALNRSEWGAVEEVKNTLIAGGDAGVGGMLNVLGSLGATLQGGEVGMNPYLMGQAQALPQARGMQGLQRALQQQGLVGEYQYSQEEFLGRAQAALGGKQERIELINQAMALKSKLGGAKAEYLPAQVQQLGMLGEAIKTMDKDILKPTAKASTGQQIQIPQEELDNLNKLYARQKEVVSELTKAQSENNKTQARKLETERDQITLDIRKVSGRAELTAAQQDVDEYRERFARGQLDRQGVRQWRTAEKQLDSLQEEQAKQADEEKAGPWGRTARAMLGGFGLMYARSIYGIATQGLGYGMQERQQFDVAGARALYSATGIAQAPVNQQAQLQTTQALYGTNYDPRIAGQQLMARTPWARDLGQGLMAGVSTWGFSQFAAQQPGMGWLGRASVGLGVAAGVGSLLVDANARAQDPSGLAYRMSTGRYGPTDVLGVGMSNIGANWFNNQGAQANFQNYQQQSLLNEWMSQNQQRGASTQQLMNAPIVQGGQQLNIGTGADRAQWFQRKVAEQYQNYSPEAQAQAAGFAISSGMNVEDPRLKGIISDYQLGGQGAQLTQGILGGFGYTPAQMYARRQPTRSEALVQYAQGNPYGATALTRQGELQAYLTGGQFTEEQRAQMGAGAQFAGQIAGFRYLPGMQTMGVEQTAQMASQLGQLQGTAGAPAYQAAVNAAMYAQQSGLQNVQTPQIAQYQNLTLPQGQMMENQASALAAQAQMRMQQQQQQMNRSYQFGNYGTGNTIGNIMQNAQPGTEWAYNRLYNMDPQMLAFMGTQGMNLGGMNIKSMAGGINAAFFPQQDIGLGGQMTGLQYGRTSFAQAGGFNAQTMMTGIFGNNWQTNQRFSQGALNAGLNGQALSAPVTLPNGQVISQVGGSMGMQLYQDQLQRQQQEAQLNRAQASNNLQFAFTTGVGLNQYNNTVDPRTGRTFGNLGRTGGFWGLEDRSRDLSNEQQQWQFGFQQRQLGLGHSQFVENMAFSQRQSGIQRGWARQDWGFQDEMRGMQWGWKQEDFQENLRFTTGRERRLGQRQMERETILHDKEGEQIDRQRGRQKEMWKLEDERFDIQKKQHMEQLEMQQEQLDKAKEHWEEQRKIQDEQIKLQRAYFIQQQMLQKQALEDEKKYAEENMKLRETFTQMQLAAELTHGQLNLVTEDGFEQMRAKIAEINPALAEFVDAFGDLFGSMLGGGAPQASQHIPPSMNIQAPTAPIGGGGGKPKPVAYAEGGFPDPGSAVLVGERGREILMGGQVISNPITERLLQRGFQPGSSKAEGDLRINQLVTEAFSQMQPRSEVSPLRSETINYGSSKPRVREKQPIIIKIGNEELRRYVQESIEL